MSMAPPRRSPWPRRPGALFLAASAAVGGCGAEPHPRPAAPEEAPHRPAAVIPRTSHVEVAAAEPEPPACDPWTSAGFDRPKNDHVPLGDAPIQWGDRLAPFYEELARLERGKRRDHVRIGFHGDSNLTKDSLTGELRRTLQARFGDSGHGFLAPLRAWGWYTHEDASQGNDMWWRVLAISAPRAPDLGYGVSGIAAEARAVGAHTWFATAGERSRFGRTASRIGVFFRAGPGGGRFRVLIDGKAVDEVSTAAETNGPGHRLYQVQDTPHRVDLETTTADVVRLLGVHFERGEGSLVVDSFGVGGVYFQALTLDDHAMNRAMEKIRRHDLVVYWLGANPHHNREYRRDVKVVVEERRREDPTLPILLIGPPDAVARINDAASDPMSRGITSRMGEAAGENGCAFWPMREAQGGDGSSARFLQNGLATDRQHLSIAGSRLMAHMLLHELWKDYRRYLAEHPRAGCDPVTR